MNWLDIVLILAGALFIVGGFKTGLVRSVLGLAAFVAGLLCALWFYSSVGGYVREHVSVSRPTANLLAFFAIFIGILVLGALAGRLLQRLLRFAHLSWLDRLLGAAFGSLQAVLVAAVIVLAILAFAPKPGPQAVTDSWLAPYVIDAARTMAAAAPHEVKEGFHRSYERVKEIWSDALKRGIHRAPAQEL